tara:strand:+ start:4938 stop:5819 length:882 start_codon:yes stop_codon:yes gene_type:complete
MKSQHFLLFIFLFLCLLLSSCKTTSLKVGNVDIGNLVNQGVNVFNVNNIDEKQEIQFGENMSAVLLGTRPLYGSKEINIYVNHVGLWLASNSERPDLPWHFSVINSSSINAFAAPGGYVFITSAMLNQLTNEAQLAAVLAHEIIHVVEQHHLNAIKEGAMRDALTESLFVSVEAYQANTGASNEQQEYKAWSKQISSAAQDLYSKGLNRDDELQADQQGIRLLARAGYDPFAFITNLQLLNAIAADDSSLALLYKTHPTPEQRLAALSNSINELSNVSGALLVKRFQKKIHPF